MAESCKGCKFWRPLNSGGGIYACHFLLDTGIPRCYPAEECIYNTKGMNDMPKALPPEVIGQIELMNAEGKTIEQICETLGVSSSTVTRVRNKMKEKSPAAVTADAGASTENASITDIPIITDNAENVKQIPTAAQYSPYEPAVDEAVLERIEKLRDKIADLQLDISNYETELNVLEKFHLKYMEVQNSGT